MNGPGDLLNSSNQNLRTGLLLLRITIFVVMFMWTIDKFMRPQHAAAVLSHFYNLSGIGFTAIRVIAAVELVLVVLFLFGMFKTLTYGAMLILHAATTLVSYQQYLHPFEKVNLLFFAAWPMLAACIMLFLMRREDRLFSFGTG